MADRRGGTRQRKHWHSIGDTLQKFTAAGTAILGSFTAAGNEPYTVLRMVGELVVTPGITPVIAGDAAIMAVGVAVVTTDALTVGSSAMPDPAGEPDFDWLWRYQAHMVFPFATADLAGLASESARIPLESKAMRKVSPRQSLVMLAEYVDLQGTPPLDVLGSARFLIGI